MEILLKIDDLGYPYFREPSMCQIHIRRKSCGPELPFGLALLLGPRRKDHVEFGEAFLLEKFPTGDGLAKRCSFTQEPQRPTDLEQDGTGFTLKLRNPKGFPSESS